MSETVKVNLTKTLAIFSIVSIVAGLLWGSAMVYAGIDNRIDGVVLKQEKFESVIEERTRTTQKRVDEIYNIIIKWEPTPQHKHN